MAYATKDELATYLGVGLIGLPNDADRLLERASEYMDEVTLEQIDLDDANHVDAARKATCAQVEFWLQTGEEHDILGVTGEVQAGSTRHTLPDRLAKRAKQYLRLAGLTYRKVGMM